MLSASMKALIKVGYGCNNHCTFCHTLEVRHIDGSDDEVMRKIRRARELGHTMAVLSGGEVTMRPELLKWAAYSASLGMDFGLVTNGRMLCYPQFVEKLEKYRLKYVYMSLHGGDARVHNLMVRADAFEQTYGAVGVLSGRGLDLTVNTVITRHNLDHLTPIVDAILPYRDVVLKFSMVQPKGGGERLFDHLMPRVSEVAARVREAIAYGESKRSGDGPTFAHDGIPFCLLPGYENLYDDLKTHRFATMIEIGEPDYFPVDDRAKVQPDDICRTCVLRGPCPGLYRGYDEVYGHGEITAVVDRPRSNSFTFTPEGVPWEMAGSACPVLESGTTPWDRGRHVFVREGSLVRRFRTQSRDFTDLEIEHTKHEQGQIYLDVSTKNAPDDFARDLRQLRRSEICNPCPERSMCSGMFEVLDDDVFTRDDQRLRDLLRSLRGSVLDLGCGEGPYGEVFEPLVASGIVQYVGVEPDEAKVSGLRTRWPWARIDVGSAENLEQFGAATFDHVLVLRSWNHFRDPRRAVTQIARALRPDGSLIVVDNVAFGLLRSEAHDRTARTSGTLFEHYRNDTAADALQLAAGEGFDLVERSDVAPGSSNQWLLRLRRRSQSSVAA